MRAKLLHACMNGERQAAVAENWDDETTCGVHLLFGGRKKCKQKQITIRDVADSPRNALHDVNDDNEDDTRPRHAADTAICASSPACRGNEKNEKCVRHARWQLG